MVGGIGLALPAFATDGVLEINHACAVDTGCLPGDAPGYPITLSAPGSHRLTGNLNPSGPRAILISTGNATVDLNGFVVSCQGAPSPGLHCLGVDGAPPATREGNEIRNGVVRGGGDAAVHLGDRSRVERVRAEAAIGNGIEVGTGSVVSGCAAYRNFGDGFFAEAGSLIERNVSSLNGSAGIRAGWGSTISENTALGNTGAGIVAGGGASVQRNTMQSNSDYGLSTIFGGVYRENTISLNGAGGVLGGFNRGDNFCSGSNVSSSSCP